MTTKQLLDRYEREYVNYHQITEGRWREQRRLLLAFGELLGRRPLSSATYSDLQGFAGSLIADGFHVNTVRKKLNMIRPVYSWMYAAGIISADQYMAIRSVKDPRGATATSTPKPYSPDQMSAFWPALDAAWPLVPPRGLGSRAIIRWERGQGGWRPVWRHAMRLQIEGMVRLALDCGLRKSEIFRLELDDLHYDNEHLVVWRAAKGRSGRRVQQSIPMTGQVRQALYTWVEFRSKMKPGHDRPWLSCYGPWSTNAMADDRFDTLLQDTIGPEWTWHRFRHTCATEWLRAGMELAIVSRLMGHSSLAQTLMYAEIVSGDVSRHMEKYEETFNNAVGRERAA